MAYTLGELAQHIGAECVGQPDIVIHRLAPIEDAKTGELTFLHNPSYKKHLATTQASAVLLSPAELPSCKQAALVVKNPYYGYAQLSHLFASQTPKSSAERHPTAIVAEDATVHPSATIGPYAVLGHQVTIGAHSVIGAGVVIGDRCQIGSYTQIYPQVTLYHDVIIKDRVLIHSGVVIGADGFGVAKYEGKWHKIAQLGTVIIEDDVEVGANTTIDRGALHHTIIGQGVKIDNQVQIGHNVTIGPHTAIAGCAGIAGSTTIGAHCVIGGASGINGHINITDNVAIAGMSGVIDSIDKAGVYSSNIGALDNLKWRKIMIRIKQLNEYIKRIQALERQVNKLIAGGELP